MVYNLDSFGTELASMVHHVLNNKDYYLLEDTPDAIKFSGLSNRMQLRKLQAMKQTLVKLDVPKFIVQER